MYKIAYISSKKEFPPSNCFKIPWITNFSPPHYPNQPLYANIKAEKKGKKQKTKKQTNKQKTGALLFDEIPMLLFLV